jgi:hypothetical protein
MRSSIVGALAAAALAGASTPASAAIMMATFAGATPYGGTDYAGLFGPAGASLAYKPVTLTVTYDTEAGNAIVSPGEDFHYGGTQFGGQGPIISALVTIDGASQALDLSYYSYVDSYAGAWTWLYGRINTEGNNTSEFSITFYDGAAGDLEAPVSTYGYGSGYLTLYKPNDWGELLAETEFELGGMDIAYVGPSPGGMVPEPSTWALAILGFGLAGAALRARRPVLI